MRPQQAPEKRGGGGIRGPGADKGGAGALSETHETRRTHPKTPLPKRIWPELAPSLAMFGLILATQ